MRSWRSPTTLIRQTLKTQSNSWNQGFWEWSKAELQRKEGGRRDLRVGQPWRSPDPTTQAPTRRRVPAETHPLSNPFLASLSSFSLSPKQMQQPFAEVLGFFSLQSTSSLRMGKQMKKSWNQLSPSHFDKAQLAQFWSRTRAETWRGRQWLGVKRKTHVMVFSPKSLR